MLPTEIQQLIAGDDLVSFSLGNGLPVLFKPHPTSQMVAVKVFVRTGSIHEGPWEGCGVSHFLEHLCFKGTERRSGEDLVREVSARGGYFNAYTSYDVTCYHILGPTEAFSTFADILEDMVFHSSLSAEHFETEREVILREIAMSQDQPDWRLAEALWNTVFKVHPARHPIIGYEDLFSGLKPEDIQSTYRDRYSPQQSVLSIAGGLAEPEVRRVVETVFGRTPRRRVVPRPVPTEPPQLARRELRLEGDVSMVRGSLIQTFDASRLEDLTAAKIWADALGGGPGSSLVRELRRDRKWVNHIDASALRIGDEGLFWIYYVCEEGRSEEVEAHLEEALNRAHQEGLPGTALEQVRRKRLAAEVRRRQTAEGLAEFYGEGAACLGDPLAGMADFRVLHALDPADLSKTAQSLFNPDRRTLGTLGPTPSTPAKRPPTPGTRRSGRDIEMLPLPNGCTLILEPHRRLPLFSLSCGFEGGYRLLGEGPPEISNLFGELWTQDTQQHTAEEVATLAEGCGARFGASSDFFHHALHLHGLTQTWEEITPLFANALLHLNFQPKSLEVERTGAIADLREESDDLPRAAFRELRCRLFPNTLYGKSYHDSIAGLTSITMGQVSEFWSRIRGTGRRVFALSGHFDRAQAMDWIERLAHNLHPHPSDLGEGGELPSFSSGTDHRQVQREQTLVVSAFPFKGRKSLRQRMISQIALTLWRDMAGHLFHEVREKRGLAYFVAAAPIAGGIDRGVIGLYAGCQPGKEGEVLKAFDSEIDRVSKGLQTAEFEAAREQVRAALRTEGERVSRWAPHQVSAFLSDLPVDAGEAASAALESIEPEEISTLVAHGREQGLYRFTMGPTPADARLSSDEGSR